MFSRPARAQNRWRTASLALVQIACVAYVVHSLWRDRAALGHALDLSGLALLSLIALNALAHLQRSLEFTYMLRRLGVTEPFWSGFLLTGAGYLLNHLPLNAGFVLRAVRLKRDHALPYSSYLGLTLVNALINVAAGACIGLLAVGSRRAESEGSLTALITLAGMLVGAGVLLCLPASWAPRDDAFLSRRLRVLLEGASLIRGNGSGIVLLAGLALSRIAGNALRLWLCFDALGAAISPLGAALLGWGSALFTLINLTPGNLGLRELALALAAAELGSTQSLGLAAASIDRVVVLSYVIAVGVPGLLSLRQRASQPS